MNALISSIGLKCSDELYAKGTFINYEESYSDLFYLKLGFGRVRPIENGLPFDMIGIEFSASADVEIPVINSGVVCASGEDRVLGKYVVVDHGYGLKSWYCNLSEALVSVGDAVTKGEAIAKTGNSAFYSQSGFYLVTTVLGTPVSPYAIYEGNFVLPQ
jgi:murein DD-endopeptidase MepM/ murein hydrolase activator NlpD